MMDPAWRRYLAEAAGYARQSLETEDRSERDELRGYAELTLAAAVDARRRG